MSPAERARRLIDEVHARDTRRTPAGQPAELAYADRLESWVARLVPDASELLRLAARCQHLERFAVPRAGFPEGRAGYHAWRRSLYARQAGRARELLLEAGYSAAEAARGGRLGRQGRPEDQRGHPGAGGRGLPRVPGERDQRLRRAARRLSAREVRRDHPQDLAENERPRAAVRARPGPAAGARRAGAGRPPAALTPPAGDAPARVRLRPRANF